ncbi:serpin family protein [Pseudothermotoga thermarum]|uniref:Proteinase inhibitor I4 serpin n=1 Tax=Pseudothermotoga thermarum DSM 5069 TaxID=688269 RepID=F7YWG1_9THEM|nr:serpin family protein [Pseudothermotoga thermarum]AEH51940.1 proteinase inhibitor I4 serpin [Pseudothermotoga thermarum DSM 5069]
MRSLVVLFAVCLGLMCFANSVSDSINDFGFNIFKVLPAEQNLFISPTSISMALTMTSFGAAGKTLQEMLETLCLSKFEERDILKSYRELVKFLNEKSEYYELRIANALWAQQGYPFLESFLKVVSENFQAPVEEVDFVDSVQRGQTRAKINKWISDVTNGRIPELISADDIDELTRLVLTNAIYFKGKWLYQFDSEKTQKDVFHSITGDVEVDMMKISQDFEYYEDENVQVAKIPYIGEKLYMLVVLPKKGRSIREVEERLNSKVFSKWIANTSLTKLDLSMPRFKFRNRFSLVKPLMELGMVLAFTNYADFSRMTPVNDLKITEVLHEAFIEVNEEGSEAAAATAVIMGIKMAFASPIVLKLDRPFLFFVVEKSQNLVLFMGRVVDPTK